MKLTTVLIITLIVILTVLILLFMAISKKTRIDNNAIFPTPTLSIIQPTHSNSAINNDIRHDIYNGDVLPSDFIQQEDDFQRQNNPDVFLKNKLPYASTTFYITSAFKTEPTGHFAFQVTSKIDNKDQAKQDANNWLKSLGLSDQQIQSLDITYQ